MQEEDTKIETKSLYEKLNTEENPPDEIHFYSENSFLSIYRK